MDHQDQEKLKGGNAETKNFLHTAYECFYFGYMEINEEFLQPKASQDLERTKMQESFGFEADMGNELLEYEVFHFHERENKDFLEILEDCDQPILEHVYFENRLGVDNKEKSDLKSYYHSENLIKRGSYKIHF